MSSRTESSLGSFVLLACCSKHSNYLYSMCVSLPGVDSVDFRIFLWLIQNRNPKTKYLFMSLKNVFIGKDVQMKP
jgi:hypothetical protein